jgi:hypothetical protein
MKNLIKSIRTRLRRLPNAGVGRNYLAEKFGEDRTKVIFSQVKARYLSLLDQRQLPRDPVLRFHEVRYILPGLALYRVLLQEYDGDVQAAMTDVEEVVRLTILDQTRLLFSPLKWPRRPFPLFRRGFELVMKAFPSPAWKFEYLEKSPQRVAFNITRCFYFDVLTQLGTPELTRVFCRADDAMAEHFPPEIQFKRNTTIGKGGEFCDFQYIKR